MFWNYNQSSSPQIDNVFCKEDLTLQELLDQENILQELKSQNKKLIDFLIKPEVLSELVTLITTEPLDDVPETDRYKHPNIACELLTSDIPSLTENLVKNSDLLSKLYSFLETEPPLNPLLASFFSRTMGVLVVRRTEQNWYSYQFTCLQVLDFLKTKETSVSLILKHLGTSAIMDLALKLVTQVEGSEMRQNILNFLATEGLVENMVELLGPGAGASVNANVALLLCDIIVKSREARLNADNKPEPDPILSALETGETVKKILDVIFSGEKKESSLIGGIAVLLTLLDPAKPVGVCPDSASMVANYSSDDSSGAGGDSSAQTPPPLPPITVTTMETIIPYLGAFHDLLVNPPVKPAVTLTCGVVDPPLGNTRLQVVRLLAALIAKHNQQVDEQLAALDTPLLLLNLFFRYSWNNFLHTQVEKCLNLALAVDEPADNTLLHNIFVKCSLLRKILEAWKENEEEQSKASGCRKGYMGHLTRLSITINSYIEKNLGTFLKAQLSEEEFSDWQQFTNGPLAKVKTQMDTCLGGKHPSQTSSDDDERNFRNGPFQQDSQFHQQVYTEYQTQEMAPQFIDNYGFNETELVRVEGNFNDMEGYFNPSIDRLAHLSFSVTDDEELERQAEMFKQVCAQKLQCLETADDDDEVWSDHNLSSRIWNGGEEIANYNSSDDEERPGPEGREEATMEIDQADPWATAGTVALAAAAGPADPWGGSDDAVSADDAGWANFEANFVAADADTEPLPTSTAPTTESDNVSSAVLESRSEPLGASGSEPQDKDVDKKDDNANPSLQSEQEKTTDEQQLIDNFRFLSSQGLISEKTEQPSPTAAPVEPPQPPESSPSEVTEGAPAEPDPVPPSKAV